MANATPPNMDRSRRRGDGGQPRIEKSTVEARQGRPGVRVLIILGVSLALLGIAYFVIHGYFAGTPHQTVSASPWPVLGAAALAATPNGAFL